MRTNTILFKKCSPTGCEGPPPKVLRSDHFLCKRSHYKGPGRDAYAQTRVGDDLHGLSRGHSRERFGTRRNPGSRKGCHCVRPPDLDSKAEPLRVDHPLGLQIAINTGVAHGIIIVRSPEDCAKMLRKVLSRERTFTIRHEKGNFLLEETDTKSVLRVVSDDPYLTHAFWTFFHQTDTN